MSLTTAPSVLCVGSLADDTFRHGLRSLNARGVQFDLIDLAQLAHSGEICIILASISDSVLSLHSKIYRLGSYSAALVRLIDIAHAAPTEYLAGRASGLYLALSQLFSEVDLPVINPPLGEASNLSKFYHAQVLSEIGGWPIPRSCLTNDPREAVQFIETCESGVIFKGSGATKTWATRYDPGLHEDSLDSLATSPVLFQERITGPDVRVHVVGTKTFAERIDSEEVDYRTTGKNTHRVVQPPNHIRAGSGRLTRSCGQPLLGVDFKIDNRNGEWVFLEANSMPCYEGYDLRASGAISAAIVDWLACGSGMDESPEEG